MSPYLEKGTLQLVEAFFNHVDTWSIAISDVLRNGEYLLRIIQLALFSSAAAMGLRAITTQKAPSATVPALKGFCHSPDTTQEHLTCLRKADRVALQALWTLIPQYDLTSDILVPQNQFTRS